MRVRVKRATISVHIIETPLLADYHSIERNEFHEWWIGRLLYNCDGELSFLTSFEILEWKIDSNSFFFFFLESKWKFCTKILKISLCNIQFIVNVDILYLNLER